MLNNLSSIGERSVSIANEILANIIRAELSTKSMTVGQLEEQAGLTMGTLDSYLNHSRPLGVGEFYDVARVLGIDAAKLVESISKDPYMRNEAAQL